MILRYPLKPKELYPADLPELDDGTSYAEQKLDGWRCFVVKDKSHTFPEAWGGSTAWARKGDLFFLSRRGIAKGGPTNFAVCDDIVDSVVALNLQDKTFLDGEWLERRTKEDGIGECLYVFDCLWLDDNWVGYVGSFQRRKIMLSCVDKGLNEYLRIPDMVESGFAKFFEKQKSIPWTEGVVVKDKLSTIELNLKDCTSSGIWQKIKWRSGDDGRKLVA